MKELQKVLIVAAALRIGGAEKVARDIGLCSDPEKYEVHYLVFGNKIGEYEQDLQNHGCKIFHVDSPNAGYLRFYFALRQLIRENGYVVVHAHTMFNAGLIMLASWQEGVPVRISHAHSALNDGRGAVKRAYEAVMRRWILRYATDLIACGEAAGNRLFGKEAFSERGLLILNGIRTEHFRYEKEARDRIRRELQIEGAYVIGHVGHMASVKNQSFLIRLLPEVCLRRPDAKLLLLGDGEDRPRLEQLASETGMKNHVIMLGTVRNVPDYLSAMDVFAFPSLYEGMPLSIVEAQANGLPCVLSTGVPKDVYLTDLVTPLSLDEPDRWVEAICSSKRSEPELYHDILKRGGFDTEEVMKKIYHLYERTDRN